MVALLHIQRIVMIARIGIVEAKDRIVALYGCHPTDALVLPSQPYQIVALGKICRIEMLAAVRVIEAVHILLVDLDGLGFRFGFADGRLVSIDSARRLVNRMRGRKHRIKVRIRRGIGIRRRTETLSRIVRRLHTLIIRILS